MGTVSRTKAPATTTATGKSAATTTAAPSHGPIAQRAYEIWQESGCPHGSDQEHWFRAEREPRARQAMRP